MADATSVRPGRRTAPSASTHSAYPLSTASRLSPAEHYAYRDAVDRGYAEWVDAEGAVRLPGRTLVASATA